jgi:hypothetical protein
MNIKNKAFVPATVLVTALCVLESEGYGQSPGPSSSPAAGEQAADKEKSDPQATAKTAAAKPAPTAAPSTKPPAPEADFRHQEEMTGNSYTDLSEVLKDNLDIIPDLGRRLRSEHQVEVFYNLHITPWLQLTGNLQIIRPNRPIADTAVVPGLRLKMVF